MALPASGTITFANLQTELDGVTAGANAASLSEYYAGGSFVTAGSIGYPGGVRTAIPSSGAISLDNFYGAKWLGGITYEYTTAGTYTVTIPNRTGFVKNYQWSCFLVGGGGGGGGAHGSTAPNRDPIGSGGGGGGGNHTTFSGTSSASSLTFTVVVGAGGAGGASSSANNPYTPKGSPGSTGGTSSLTINSVLQGSATGGGGGGGGSIEPDVGGTGGTSTTAYPGGAGQAVNDANSIGGAGGDSVLSNGAYIGVYNPTAAQLAGKYGSGAQGGGGTNGTVYSNGGTGGAGYARVTFKNSISTTTSQTFASPTTSGSFTVPAGIYQIYTSIVGAGGNNGSAGGYVEALLAVTPGETLIVRVGGTGGSTATASTYAAGGTNGGGRGYTFNTNTAYGGGGYSGIFRSTQPLAIAGGGGGGGAGSGSGAGGLFSDSILVTGSGTPGTISTGGTPNGAYLTGGDTNATKNAGSGGGGGYYGGGGSGTSVSGVSFSGGGGSNFVISGAASLYNMSGFNQGGSWGGTYGAASQGGRVIIYY